MSEEELQVELDKRQVYYKETESRDMLVHLLEMDILSQSQRIKAKYVDYGVRKITAFDIFNEYYGSYTGPMLSSMLKEKGIRPPRKVIDRVQIVLTSIDKQLRSSFQEAFKVVTKELYTYKGGEGTSDLKKMFHFLLSSF